MRSAGEAAVLVAFDGPPTLAAHRRVMGLRLWVSANPLPGLLEVIPSLCSVLVEFDPLQTSLSDWIRHLEKWFATACETAEASVVGRGRAWRLPVCFHGDHAPDLRDVATALGIEEDSLISRICSCEFPVLLLGAVPGSAIFGPLPNGLHMPRRQSPRAAVEPGSLATAIGLGIIYPVRMPGGWHIVGHCPVPIFEPRSSPPSLVEPGDLITLRLVDPAEHTAISSGLSTGRLDAAREFAAT